MSADDPGLESQLRAAGRDVGLEKAMAFAAVRHALLGDALEIKGDLGKYRVLERLGAGGMGAVFAAWDPELERRVAIKVLVGDAEASAEQKLIMREAKAAAQLSHPNVVTVFEVGMARGRVFLAMEYIRGRTMRAWAQTEPPADDRLAVLLQAGRGLEAAHARGLVHRDFKPDNVLVDEALRAKVVDFGLAHSSAEALEGGTDVEQTEPSNAALTQTGSRSGTPHYMAPEVLRGRPANARSDQFSFAVTAWEVLCGTRPFERNDDPGEPRGRPVSSVPRGVMQALSRALHADPARRFPSMSVLLDAIDPAPKIARRNRRILGSAVVLTLGAIAWGMRPTSEAPSLCTGAAERLQGVWDETSRADYEAAFASADPADGTRRWRSAAQTLQRYAEGWIEASTEACEATRVRGEQSDATYTLRTRCLDDRLRALRGLTERFSTVDEEGVRRAASAAAELPSIERCNDAEYLQAQVEPAPAAIVGDVEDLREQMASLSAAEALGQYKVVSTALEPVLRRGSTLDHPPLSAELSLLEGRIAHRMGKMPQARTALEQAVLHATGSRHDGVLADALILLVLVVGFEQQQSEDGLWLARQAEATLGRLGEDPERRAKLLMNRGLLRLRAGSLDEARSDLESAEALLAEHRPTGALRGVTANKLANISITLGEWSRAETELGHALALAERVRGPEHPDVGSIVANQGVVYRNLDRLDDARASFERARAIFAAHLGETHPKVAAVDMNLGNVALQAQDIEGAVRVLDQSAARLEAALGEEHMWTIKAINARGHARILAKQLSQGRADIERALRLLARVSPDAIELGNAQCYRASALANEGDFDGAREAFDVALATFGRLLGPAIATNAGYQLCLEMKAGLPSPK